MMSIRGVMVVLADLLFCFILEGGSYSYSSFLGGFIGYRCYTAIRTSSWSFMPIIFTFPIDYFTTLSAFPTPRHDLTIFSFCTWARLQLSIFFVIHLI